MTAILDIPADLYHADQVADQPTLSSSLAKLLVNASPLHAWTEHPKLNPGYVKSDDEKFDVGTCAHSLLLQEKSLIEIVPADSWRTQVAKDLRDEARAAGLIPLLPKQAEEVLAMVQAARSQFDCLDVRPAVFMDGKPEQTLVWEDERGVVCRIRVDWLHDSFAAADDLKTTSRSANPAALDRHILSLGYDIQAAMYVRGIRAVTGCDPEFRFVFVETAPPYAVSVHSLLPGWMELANDKVTYAIRKWAACLANNEWPGYPSRVCWHEAPGWADAQWLEKEAREQTAAA